MASKHLGLEISTENDDVVFGKITRYYIARTEIMTTVQKAHPDAYNEMGNDEYGWFISTPGFTLTLI